MISRRRILSRSRDELLNQQSQYPDNYNPYEEEEDVWYSKDKLLKFTYRLKLTMMSDVITNGDNQDLRRGQETIK
ncbi:hypothetical protein BLOT_007970 [Blomia tropicalis]|nr:hypothetical protein BLOT_007970 [Blomia tropicalis]